jgi:hypothetical protein
MDKDPEIEQQVRTLIYDMLVLLYGSGITSVNVGGLLRILGVPNDTAIEHDEHFLEISAEIDVQNIDLLGTSTQQVPKGTTLH